MLTFSNSERWLPKFPRFFNQICNGTTLTYSPIPHDFYTSDPRLFTLFSLRSLGTQYNVPPNPKFFSPFRDTKRPGSVVPQSHASIAFSRCWRFDGVSFWSNPKFSFRKLYLGHQAMVLREYLPRSLKFWAIQSVLSNWWLLGKLFK